MSSDKVMVYIQHIKNTFYIKHNNNAPIYIEDSLINKICETLSKPNNTDVNIEYTINYEYSFGSITDAPIKVRLIDGDMDNADYRCYGDNLLGYIIITTPPDTSIKKIEDHIDDTVIIEGEVIDD